MRCRHQAHWISTLTMQRWCINNAEPSFNHATPFTAARIIIFNINSIQHKMRSALLVARRTTLPPPWFLLLICIRFSFSSRLTMQNYKQLINIQNHYLLPSRTLCMSKTWWCRAREQACLLPIMNNISTWYYAAQWNIWIVPDRLRWLWWVLHKARAGVIGLVDCCIIITVVYSAVLTR